MLVNEEARVHPHSEVKAVKMASFWQQLKALLWRNILLKKRSKAQLFQEMFYPVYFVAILAMIRALTKPAIQPSLHFPANNISDSAFGDPFGTNKLLYVVPDSAKAEQWTNSVIAQLPGSLDPRFFPTKEDAESSYNQNASDVFAGIIFNYEGGQYSYAIRMGFDALPDSTRFYNYDKGSCRANEDGTSTARTDYQCSVNKYLSQGFAQLQLAVENVLMENLSLTNPDPKSRKVKVQMMDKDEFSPDTSYIQTISSIYFVFSFAFLANFLSVNIVTEKEKKIKDGMLMMGLRSSVFWLSWSIIYLAMITFAAALMIVIIVGAQFFKQSNMLLLFISFILYGCSIIAFAFMVTPFFNKAKVAGAITGFSTVIISCIYLAVSQTRSAGSYDSKLPPGVQWLMCLLSPISFATFIDQAIFLDIQLDGFDFDESMTYGKFPLWVPLIMLLVDTILYALLTIYLDNVIPGEYGVRYSPLYCLTSSYWCPPQHSTESSPLMSSRQATNGTTEHVDVEPVPSDIENNVAMRISSLTKSFKSEGKLHHAVDGFCLDIYESQITCLLGHNGAGKTTLINMLTGVIPPTSGFATIMGLDITKPTDLLEIRKRCGICPQHNILYDDLSCREHLLMFANIKGVPQAEAEKTVEQALKDVDLTNQSETFAKDLSGGQKRKLSVAIALIGDPRLIFLDEPTAGMDPYSRRHLWSLLKKKKEGRVVLLTTHFMDEADILADRKAFIRKGKLRCCGSSLFLKNKFGVGYHLTMVVTPNCDISKVTTVLQSVIPDIQHERSHGKEISYTVPLSDVSKFAELFGMLDEKAEGLGVRSYGVSMTTLEEVFLKLEADDVADDENLASENAGFDANHEDVNIDMQSPLPVDDSISKSVVKGKALTKQRYRALLWIRFLLIIRSAKAVIFQVVLPIILVVVGLVLSKINEVSPTSYPTPYIITTERYVGNAGAAYPPGLLVFDAVGTASSQAVINRWQTSLAVNSYPAGTQNTSDVAPHFMGMQIDSTVGQVLTDFVVLYNDSALHSIPTAINLATQSMLENSNISNSINATNFPWPKIGGSLTYNAGAMSSALLIGLAFILVLPGFSSEIVKDREVKLRSQLRISGVSFNIYWLTIYATFFVVYLIPAVVIIIVVLAMQIPGLSSGGAIGALILVFITNIPFNLIMALVLSFLFNKAETCIAYLPILLNMLGMLPYLAVSLVDMIAGGNTGIILHYVFCVIDPPYLMFGAFYFISRVSLIAVTRGLSVSNSDYFQMDNHIMIAVIMPIVHAAWMYWLLRVLDVKKTGGNIKEAFPCFAKSIDETPAVNNDIIEDEDEDVKAERSRIESLNTVEEMEPVAYTSQLRKTFVKRTKSGGMCKPGSNKTKVAVRNLSIGVDKGEVLGLLGPNGAGKSTALNMVIAETGPTAGKVVVSGHNIRSNMLSVLESLGYCPQHDALWETITLEEHIKCFAAIKGIDPNKLDDVSDFYVENLKLQEHQKKHSKKLSGGTKRKLSYIMSMLGSPHLVLMDEPSTGMDPQSKRFLWDTISSSFSNTDRGAILTTHYMEEADALCGRVGIMVNGQLECIGSTQHLKGKYGSGYILEVKLGTHQAAEVESLMDELESHLKELFPGLEQVERFLERAQYSIPKEDITSLGKTFASLENCKTSHGLEEYSFSQSSLEQVFLYFAKQQLEEGQDNSGPKPSPIRSISRRSAEEPSQVAIRL